MEVPLQPKDAIEWVLDIVLVSILVLMEVPLQLSDFKEIVCWNGVSILVLMEVPLQRVNCK